MGEVNEAAKLVAELARRSTASKSRSDQRLFTEAYLGGDFPMVLDHRCSLFQCLHLALDDLEWSDLEATFRNKTTGQVPRIFHGNGGSNMYTVVSQLGLIPTFEESFDKAVRLGLMSENQYRFIADVITSYESCRVLVVGGGHDTELWYHCCRGNMVCVEDRAEWFPRLPCKLVGPEYQGRIGTWLPEVAAPKAVAQSSWDVVVIDAPKGDSPDSPGRQEPISWASQCGAKIIFVHDYERDWERQLCDHYLGEPSQIVPFGTRDTRVLAAFNRVCSNQLPV
ncbi:MAG: hypothetical protein KIS67_28815 [Verrucomicrobiae bacterium]|nr:hypothetical protein [Verrucomicrobiae bacterium]